MGSYFLLSLWFPEPPCDPGQSDSPNPVLTLVSLYKPFRNGGSLSAGSHTPLSFPICLRTRFARGSALPGSVSRCSLSRNDQVPRAPLPFPGVTCSGGTSRSIRGSYPSFLAPTGSCARPSSSHLLDFRLVRWVFAGCHQSLLEDGPSRRYLCMSFRGCLAPYPGVSPGALSRFFPEDSGLPPGLTGSALRNLSVQRLPYGKPFSGLQAFLDVQASKFARHPSRSDRYHLRRMAAVAFTSEHRIVRYLPIRRIC